MPKPEKTFRIGSVSASVFVNQSDEGEFRTIALQRRYKDGDEWKSSNSFTKPQAAAALAVLQRALGYVLDHEDDAAQDQPV
jgi:hypothetical protein